ncbi:MAG: iron-sulfur cluster assembly accessory protein [Rhodospirillaceae bacterium]
MAQPHVMKITEAAAARVREIMAKRDPPALGLRIGVKSRGCSGLSYNLEYAEEIKPLEEIVEAQGIKLLVEPSAVMFLVGTEMDYVEDAMKAGFVFRNPNETGRCGCGESFSV